LWSPDLADYQALLTQLSSLVEYLTIPESVNWKLKLEILMKEYTFNRKVNGLRVDVATVYKFDNGKAAYETCTRGYHEVVNPDVAFATVRQWLEDMDDAHRSKHWR